MGTENKEIAGYRVTVTRDRAMHFPVSQGAEIKPGVAITVARPANADLDEPERQLYGPGYNGYEGMFVWPGTYHFDPKRRNTMATLGAYLFDPVSEYEFENWLESRVQRAVALARERDQPELEALREIKRYEGPEWIVEPIGRGFGLTSEAWDEFDEFVLWTEAKCAIIETNVKGWDGMNAILRYTGDGGQNVRDFLARFRYLNKPPQSEV